MKDCNKFVYSGNENLEIISSDALKCIKCKNFLNENKSNYCPLDKSIECKFLDNSKSWYIFSYHCYSIP